MADSTYDAILILSFGGPEKHADVTPFLENVLRGRNVPRERLLEVAEHYYHFDGRSPINDQNRALIASLESLLATSGPQLTVYWGNRNWHPFLAGTLRKMRDDGVRKALAIATSVFSSYSGCRQYLEDIEKARAEVGEGAPSLDKLRSFYNHPLFIEAQAEEVQAALEQIPTARRTNCTILFTAHSVPVAMAETSDYEAQLNETCRLVAENVKFDNWRLAFQSRSGAPGQPWLEPDVGDALREMNSGQDVVVVPIGFISDQMEVLYDLDTEAQAISAVRGVNILRAATVCVRPQFVGILPDLVL